ncbi:MAG TPA: class I SAM-dependent methyltransferase [Terriglobales bacterium]|nr:class I SAM-dependent methyltransferase [Terriglobales bacterium]
MHQTLQTIYEKRFAGDEQGRDRVWRVLTQDFFQRWVRPTDVVVDVGAGYCEFINNIRAAAKFALDLNPVSPLKAAPEVMVISQDIALPWEIGSASTDVVFSSNFFEHLPTKEALQHCLREIYRVLRPGGRMLAMGPNIRFCYQVYWDFFDHFLPLSDRSLTEALEITGFQVERVIPRFLPFTMKGKTPPPASVIRIYLRLPPIWVLFGKQFLVIARKA